jgi:hypothetical protein
MKRILAAGLISLISIQATAGSVTFVPPEPIAMVDTSMSPGSGSWLIPLMIAAVVILAVTQTPPQVNVSDSRLKADITPIGIAPNGLPLYSFRYIGFSQVYSGVMAQDVLSHTPEAIVEGPFGYMAVDYGMLGLEMKLLN